MAGRLQIRPRYRPDEPTTGDYLQQGIGGALDTYLQESEARRTEENQMRAAGGVPVDGSSPSVGDNFRRAGSAVAGGVRRIFGRGQPPSAPPTETSPTQQAPTMPAPAAAGARRFPPPISPSMAGSPGFVNQSQAPHAPMGGPNTTPPIMPPRAQSSISSAIGSQLNPTDYSYEQKTRSGRTFRIDPLRGERGKLALEDQQRTKHEQDEIDALVSTGQWTPAQASARVKGKLAYGEEFGRTRQANQLTFQQRAELVDRTNKGRMEVARIMADGRQNTVEGRQAIQQQILDLREAALAMTAAGLEATGYENAAKALEAQIPKGTDALVAGSQPGGKEKIAATTQAAATARDSAVAIRSRGAARADSSLARTGAKPKLTQAQYDAGRAKGHSDADIAKSYDVTGVRRKP